MKIVVVPHTHWDREWYQPFELFRMRLVRLIDGLLELFATDPRYTHFMLDGQSIVLEDYVAIRPEREAELKALIASGQVAVGPWYVLPDEFLVSGEAIVRNLQLGMALARRFGRSMELGYLPDSFGHVAQMPQIFQGFGFDAGTLWRGVADDVPGLEWLWEAPDGSQIYVQWLDGGYGNFANLPGHEAEAFERLQAEVARLGASARSGVRLLMNGSDHLMPQRQLPDFLEGFRRRAPDWEIVQAPITEAIAAARWGAGELAVVRGELRSAARSHLLPGVLSARAYLHQANVEAQTLLERWVEPFSALAPRAYPVAMLRHAWKTLLQNHPHDSICGCSVDAVHQEMMTRFAQVGQVGGQLRQEALAALQGEDADDPELTRQAGLRLYNPHPFAHRAAIEVELTLDGGPELTLLTPEGEVVPYVLHEARPGVRSINRSPLYPLNVPCTQVKIALVADLPPLGSRFLRIERQGTGAGVATLENTFFRIEAVPGAVVIHDKLAGQTIRHGFEDAADRGDEYNFCPDGQPPSWLTTWDQVTHSPAGLELHGLWRLPRALAPDRSSRVGEVVVPIKLTVALHEGVRRVEFALEVDNTAEDHRLRAAFTLPDPIAATRADTAFGWVERGSMVQPQNWPETPMGTFPMVGQVHLNAQGLAAAGLHEYEAVDATLYLTLLRCVGWLSRDDLSTRQGDAGPMVPAPGAQCPGKRTFRYAWLSGPDLARNGDAFLVPACGFPTAEAVDQAPTSLLAIDQPAWQFSALKQAAAGDARVLRIFNGSPEPKTGTLAFGFPVRQVRRARLDETPLDAVADGPLTLRGHEIATFLLT
ncbi:MAG: hypothetical protein JWM80_4377 [Cyanobacteria bacterium RYN_339]|nr:hypothetical protein [Cyanobacteria bacterium RYN_339]